MRSNSRCRNSSIASASYVDHQSAFSIKKTSRFATLVPEGASSLLVDAIGCMDIALLLDGLKQQKKPSRWCWRNMTSVEENLIEQRCGLSKPSTWLSKSTTSVKPEGSACRSDKLALVHLVLAQALHATRSDEMADEIL